jgi:hypothetical protein
MSLFSYLTRLQLALAGLAGHHAEGGGVGLVFDAAPVRVVDPVEGLEAELQALVR